MVTYLIPKNGVIHSINRCTRLDDMINEEIDEIVDCALDKLQSIEEKYNIQVYLEYHGWDYNEVE